MSLLRAEGLTRRFGGYLAVSDVALELADGELLGLIGPNGAGKTTIFHMLTGFICPTRGRIWLDGRDVTLLPPEARARLGLVRTFQKTSLFRGRTVAENLHLAAHLSDPGGLRRTLFGAPAPEQAAQKRHVDSLLELTRLGSRRNELAEDLAYGEQRILEIAVALAARPRVLLLDEPVAGMNATETAACMRLVREVIGTRVQAVLLVEHDMQAVMGNCSRIIVLDHGEKLAEGSAEAVRANPAVIQAYLGSDEPIAS